MNTIKTIIIAYAAGIAAMAYGQSTVVNFDHDAIGAPPEGFSCHLTGKGKTGDWRVLKDATAPSRGNVLAQTDMDATGYRFPVCVYDGVKAKNADISVKFKPVKGGGDRAAGIVWRFIDKNNYYIARANALEDNVVTYIMKNGRRTDLPLVGKGRTYGEKIRVPSGRWSELRIVVRDDLFTIYLNNAELYKVRDDTFRDPGKIGLWTKADSYTEFDDLNVTVLQ